MVHEHFDVEVSVVIAVHSESARLRQCVNNSRMGVEPPAPFYRVKAQKT